MLMCIHQGNKAGGLRREGQHNSSVTLEANRNYGHKETSRVGEKYFLSFPIRHFVLQCGSSIEFQL